MDFINKAQELFFAQDKPDVTKRRISTSGRKRSASFRSKYSLGKVLGKGTYSVVRKGIDLETRQKVAVKCIDELDLTEKDAKALQREVKILKSLKHKNIIAFKDFFYDAKEKMFFIVTEYCGGGEMFDAVVAKTYYPEAKVRQIVFRLADAIMHLHTKNITHRDLKPENILLKVPHNKGDIDVESLKIADFGFAFQHQSSGGPENRLNTVCGSPIYVAPEILVHHSRSKKKEKKTGYAAKGVDVWSLGIVMYVLLCGYPPFMDGSGNNDSNERLFEKIKLGKFEFDEKYWKDVSPVARDLITRMLNVDPKKRYSIQQVLMHPWFNDERTRIEKELLKKSPSLHISRTKLVQAKGVGAKWSNLKSAVNKLRFLSVSSSTSTSIE